MFLSCCRHLDVVGIGHRVVHGGPYFTQSTLIDSEVTARIEECSLFAPLHNLSSVKGIRAMQGRAEQGRWDQSRTTTKQSIS